jgi:cyclase
MLKPRITPCLLIQDGGLVKTVNFSNPKYVGDPLNAVKIFNEKSADELIVLDIDASVMKKEPNYDVIKKLANECRMPLCYGGGVKSVDQFKKIISLGVEKVAISSAAIEDIKLIKRASEVIGNQSVVVVIDLKKKFFSNSYDMYTDNGKNRIKQDAMAFIKEVENNGAGEIVINSIDNDGMMRGYDMDLITSIRESINIPITALGGAGSLEDIKSLIDKHSIIGAAAGSLFVFKGKYKAVLINYPSQAEKDKIIK